MPATRLVGRVRELAAARNRLMRADVRLLTLTGTGGTGKTRLALALAAMLLEAFADGVWFVDLSSITDAADVVPAIVHVLGLREVDRQRPLDSLSQALARRQLLLILDNFEQVLEAATHVASLLAAAIGLKVLVTSRTRLHLSTEHEFPVAPLQLPDAAYDGTSKGLTEYEAVALFVERAEAARPDFQVTSRNAPAVAEICARLDGLPLAIELAAARIKLLPPQALLIRLSNRLRLLTGGARDRPPRHQTLRATIDWSYGLLDDRDKTLFRRLAVFSGGWPLEAAEAICGKQLDVVEGLSSLLDNSLLRQDEAASGEPRFRMLETLREYALEQLESSGDAESIRSAYADYFCSLAESADPAVGEAPATDLLDRLQADHDNLRAVVRWAVESRKAELALRMGGALQRYLDARGHVNEGRLWLEDALALQVPVSHPVRARAACGWSHGLVAGRVRAGASPPPGEFRAVPTARG